MPRRHDAVRRAAPRCRRPRRRCRPARGRRSPEIVFMSVDLPLPFGPSSATISPGAHGAGARPTAPGSRREHVERARLEHGTRRVRHARSPRGRRRSRGGRARSSAGAPSAMTSPSWSATMRCEMLHDHAHVVLDDDEREAAARAARARGGRGRGCVAWSTPPVTSSSRRRRGPRGERAGQLEALALAGGEAARVRVRAVAEADGLQRAARAVSRAAARSARLLEGADHDVLEHGHARRTAAASGRCGRRRGG